MVKYVNEINVKESEESKDENTEDVVIDEPQEDEIEKLEKAGIQTHSGIQYCRGDIDFYKELLSQFVKESVNKEKKICDFYEQDDFDNYRILVHSLKSSAKMIGADELSKTAKQMEEAAKNQDAAYIREHEEALLAEYRATVNHINEALHSDENVSEQSVTEISRGELMERLQELKECLGTYELDDAESLLAEMNGTECQGMSTKELIGDIKRDVDDFEFDMAAEKVEHLLDTMKRGEM